MKPKYRLFLFIVLAMLFYSVLFVLAETNLRDTISDLAGINNTELFITKDPVYDVRAFGANATDGLDDVAAFQDILDTYTTDYSIFIPCGDYNFSQRWNFTSSHKRIKVYGEGDCSNIFMNDNADTSMIYLNGCDDITFESFQMNGNRAGNTGTHRGFDSGANADRPKFKNLYIHHFEDEGIFMNLNTGTEVLDCRITYTGGDGIELWKGSDYLIDGVDVHSPGGNGIFIQGSPHQDGTIVNNRVENISTDEKAGISDNSGMNVVVANNRVYDAANTANGVNGMIFSSTSNITISGNVLYNITGAGIETNGNDVSIKDNIIQKNNASTATSSGIAINGGDSVNIAGNVISYTSLNGIKLGAISANITNCVVQGNTIKNSENAAIFMQAGAGANITWLSITDNMMFDDRSSPTQEYAIQDGNGAGIVSNVDIGSNLYWGQKTANITGLTASELVSTKFDSGIQVNNSFQLGDGTYNLNMTMTDENSAEWCCGVNTTGQFNCTDGAC